MGIVEIAVLAALVIVVMFFIKPLKGWAFSIRGKMEQNLPIEAKIDRTVSDLRSKRTTIAYNLKNLKKAGKIMERQVEANATNEDRVTSLTERIGKINAQEGKTKDIAKKIDQNISHLLSEKAYVVAMIEVGTYTSEMGDNVFADTDDIFAEIEAIEDMMIE
jgi:Tfp pilus assembly protein PilO